MKTTLFLGIGGAGMKGLAYLLRESGEQVIGFDDNPRNSEITMSEATDALSHVDRFVHTDAASPSHPLRVAAREKGIAEIPYQKGIGEFSRAYTTIAVTGTHGKSSTTAFLAHICMMGGLDPSVLVGASLNTLRGKHAHLGKSNLLIVEADEYRRHFLELSPAHIIITTIDFDHPDAFSSLEDVERAYEEFATKLQSNGFLFIPEAEHAAHPNIQFPMNTKTISNTSISDIVVPLPGEHMRMNAALAIALAELLGVPRNAAISALRSFPGLGRRFELIGNVHGCDIRSDYAHHPAEITAAISGAREAYPNATITAVFEAHMPLRLRTFFAEFVSSLAHADEVIIVPPFAPAGRDEDAADDALKVRDALLAQKVSATFTEEKTEFLSTLQPNSVALLLSAGALDTAVRDALQKRT